jgi:hypothetical protein
MVQGLGQKLGPASVGNVAVHWVVLEKVLFLLPRFFHGQVGHDVLLAAVDDADKAEFERVRPACQDVEGVGAGIHQIELCQHAESPQTSRVDRASQLEGIGIGEVDVGGRYCENDTEVSRGSLEYGKSATCWAWKHNP